MTKLRVAGSFSQSFNLAGPHRMRTTLVGMCTFNGFSIRVPSRKRPTESKGEYFVAQIFRTH